MTESHDPLDGHGGRYIVDPKTGKRKRVEEPTKAPEPPKQKAEPTPTPAPEAKAPEPTPPPAATSRSK